MGALTVSIVASLYGDLYDRYVDRWAASIDALAVTPAEVIVATDRHRDIPGATQVVTDCPWRHPQAWHQNQAIAAAHTDWVWILDIDNAAHPDALDGIDAVADDVWLMGFHRTSDGLRYLPRALTNDEYLALDTNPYPAGSAIRRAAFIGTVGYRDIAFEDWGLWRALARNGATFRASTRVHYTYIRHPGARSETEMGAWNRPEHLAEMLEGESC